MDAFYLWNSGHFNLFKMMDSYMDNDPSLSRLQAFIKIVKALYRGNSLFRMQNKKQNPDGSAIVGILLNSFGLAVHGLGQGAKRAHTALIESLKKKKQSNTKQIFFLGGQTICNTQQQNTKQKMNK